MIIVNMFHLIVVERFYLKYAKINFASNLLNYIVIFEINPIFIIQYLYKILKDKHSLA